jgi:hypothetical protein
MVLHQSQPFYDCLLARNMENVLIVDATKFTKRPFLDSPAVGVRNVVAFTAALNRSRQIPFGLAMSSKNPTRPICIGVNLFPFRQRDYGRSHFSVYLRQTTNFGGHRTPDSMR